MKSLLERLKNAETGSSTEFTVPHSFALGNLDRLLNGQPPELRRALESAAIPHTWDANLLAALLDPDLSPNAAHWAESLRALPVVEKIPGREIWAVHEVTRRALRQSLHEQQRLSNLSRRAFGALGTPSERPDAGDQIEYLYHQLLAYPELGADSLEMLWQTWHEQGRYDALNQLAAILEELMHHLAGPARARGLLCHATICANRSPKSEIEAEALESLGLFKQLEWPRDQSQALTLLGEIFVRKGDLSAAEHFFTQALEIDEGLASSNSVNTAWQRDLSVSINKLGDLAVAQDNLAKAAGYFAKGRAIIESLCSKDTANAEWQRDLSVSLEKLGDLAETAGDLTAALSYFTESKEITKRLAASDLENAEWQRDLAVSHHKLAELTQKIGDKHAAEARWQACFNVLEGMKERGWSLDPAMAKLYEQLAGRFASR